MNRADFQSQETLALRKEVLIMNVTGLTTISGESFNKRAGMQSKPSASNNSCFRGVGLIFKLAGGDRRFHEKILMPTGAICIDHHFFPTG